MTLLDDFRQFVIDAQSGTQYNNWVRDNSGLTADDKKQNPLPAPKPDTDVAKWYAFRDAITSGQRPTPPTMSSPHGRELIDAGIQYLDATAVTPVPPPPPPAPDPSSDFQTLVDALMPPQFNYTRHIICTTESDALAKISAIQPGDWIDVRGVTFHGRISWNPQLSAYAKVTLDAGCKFAGVTSNTNDPALYLPHPKFFQIIFEPGAYVSNPEGGFGILAHGGDHLVVDGYHCKGVGTDGFSMFPASDGSDIAHCFIRGEVEDFCMTTRWDPHAEKGSGVHGMNVADTTAHIFHDNLIAVYVHDPHLVNGKPIGGGSCIELGTDSPATSPFNNEFYIKGRNLLWNSQTQTGGNGVNHWASGGASTAHDNVFKIIEVDNMAGYGFHRNGSFKNSPAAIVEKGRAVKCCLNPLYQGQSPWMKGSEVHYSADVIPA